MTQSRRQGSEGASVLFPKTARENALGTPETKLDMSKKIMQLEHATKGAFMLGVV